MQSPTKYRAQNPSVRPLAPRAGNRWQPKRGTRRQRHARRAIQITAIAANEAMWARAEPLPW